MGQVYFILIGLYQTKDPVVKERDSSRARNFLFPPAVGSKAVITSLISIISF